MAEHLSRMHNMTPSQWHKRNIFIILGVIVYIKIVVNNFRSLINFLTAQRDREYFSRELRELQEKKKRLMREILDMKISYSMPLLDYQNSEEFSKFLAFAKHAFENTHKVKNNIKELEERLGCSANLDSDVKEVYGNLELEIEAYTGHIKALNTAVTLIKKLKKLSADFKEIADEKSSKNETEQNDTALTEEELRKELSDFEHNLYTHKNLIENAFKGYGGLNRNDFANLLDKIKSVTGSLINGLSHKIRSFETKAEIYTRATDDIKALSTSQRKIDAFEASIKEIKIKRDMSTMNYKDHEMFSNFLESVEKHEKELDEIENSLEIFKAGVGEENEIYIALLEQVESKSSLDRKKKELEEHLEALNDAVELMKKVKDLEDKTRYSIMENDNIKKEVSSLREELKKLNEDSNKEYKLNGYKGSPDDVKNLNSDLNNRLNEIENTFGIV